MANKISIIIPNYNGKNLLAANIPQVIKNCPGCEIIVVDDGSTDASVTLLHKKFKKVRVIKHKKNKGFVASANNGVKKASSPLVLLLNSDISPRPSFLKVAVSHFKNKNLFAVGLADYSHEDNKIVIRGRGGLVFKKGFIQHFAARIERGETFWVSGGSGVFDKKKFLSIGGFDSLYTPFYWEDIDLSFRARKLGYKCIFEPLSKVDHFHQEGAIKKNYSDVYIKSISYKNQFLFVWKNISDYLMLCLHLLWLPYHIIQALLNGNRPFFIGFFLALTKIPQLIINYQLSTINCQQSDREVIEDFEKS